jgi:hypothetical protein
MRRRNPMSAILKLSRVATAAVLFFAGATLLILSNEQWIYHQIHPAEVMAAIAAVAFFGGTGLLVIRD